MQVCVKLFEACLCFTPFTFYLYLADHCGSNFYSMQLKYCFERLNTNKYEHKNMLFNKYERKNMLFDQNIF